MSYTGRNHPSVPTRHGLPQVGKRIRYLPTGEGRRRWWQHASRGRNVEFSSSIMADTLPEGTDTSILTEIPYATLSIYDPRGPSPPGVAFRPAGDVHQRREPGLP